MFSSTIFFFFLLVVPALVFGGPIRADEADANMPENIGVETAKLILNDIFDSAQFAKNEAEDGSKIRVKRQQANSGGGQQVGGQKMCFCENGGPDEKGKREKGRFDRLVEQQRQWRRKCNELSDALKEKMRLSDNSFFFDEESKEVKDLAEKSGIVCAKAENTYRTLGHDFGNIFVDEFEDLKGEIEEEKFRREFAEFNE